MFLRQSTSQVIRFGPCLDKKSAVSEETNLTLAQSDMRLSKDGGAFAQKNAAGNATHDSDGWYSTTLNTVDTDTIGELIMNVHQPSKMLPVWARWYVLEEEVYDDLFVADAVGYLKSVVAGRDIDVTATGAAGIDWGNIENPATVVDLAGTDINLVDTTTVNTDMRGTDGAALASVATETRLSELDASNLPADIDAIKADTDSLDTTKITTARATKLDNLDAAITTRATPTQVNIEVDNALDTVIPVTPTVDSINERIKNIDDKLPTGNIGDATSANQTTILNRIGDYAGTGLNTIKGFLQALFRKDAGVSGTNLPSEINEIENTITGNYDAVTDSQEAIRDTAPMGTVMRGTDDAALASIATEVRLSELDATKMPSDIDQILADTDELQIDWQNGGRLDLLIDQILADTDELQIDWVNDGRLDLLIDAILADTSELQIDWANGGRLDLLIDQIIIDIAALNNVTVAQINAEVVDALSIDIYTEPGQEAPGATVSLATKIGFLYKAWRNKSDQSADTYRVYNDNASTVDQKASVSDDGTIATKNEVITGP